MKRSSVMVAALALVASGLAAPGALRAQSSCELCVEYEETGNPHLFQQQAQCCPTLDRNTCGALRGVTITGSVEQAFCWIEYSANGYACAVDNPCDTAGGGGDGGGGGGGGGGGFCPAESFNCREAY
jgi:hypothetical protein